jgi:nicotinate phosphoribosyltransferase
MINPYRVIKHATQTDYYTYTVGCMAFNRFRDEEALFHFKLRNDAKWTKEIVDEIKKQVDHLCTLKHTGDEIAFLAKQKDLAGKHEYFKFLEIFQMDRKNISIELTGEELKIEIRGKWSETIYFEVPVLSIVNAIYFKFTEPNYDKEGAYKRLLEKKALINEYALPVDDFGTRRAIEFEMQNTVVESLKECPTFKGTSNVYLSMIHGVQPIGTMSHQAICAGAGLKQIALRFSQKYMLEQFAEEFPDSVLIALSDTYGFDAFLKDFSGELAHTYHGMRHDSSDPFEWAEKAIQFYKDEGIDPKTKILVFSDSLTIKKCIALYERFKDQAIIRFGVGTHLTNDVPGVNPLQIVIKLMMFNGVHVAKESDNPAKSMCLCPITKAYIRMTFGLPQLRGVV